MADGTTVLKSRRRREADAKRSRFAARGPLRSLYCPLSQGRHFLYAFQESLARNGELRAMGEAMKQLLTKN